MMPNDPNLVLWLAMILGSAQPAEIPASLRGEYIPDPAAAASSHETMRISPNEIRTPVLFCKIGAASSSEKRSVAKASCERLAGNSKGARFEATLRMSADEQGRLRISGLDESARAFIPATASGTR